MLSENDLELLSSYLDGALTEPERAALEARLQTDADLRRELARLRATVDLVKTLPTLTAPRSFALTPRMVRRSAGLQRRPNILTSPAFSALSAAAAIILLVIGVTLFSARPTAQNGVLGQVAFAPTSAAQLPPSSAQEASGGIQANAPSVTMSKQATQEAQSDLLAAPTVLPPMLQFSAVALPTETPLAPETQSFDAARNTEGSAESQQSSVAPVPLAMNGAAAAQAPLQAALPSATPAPTNTSTLMPTATPSPTNTAPPTNTPSSTPTITPTFVPTPIPAAAAVAQPNPLAVGLIVLALLLFAVAFFTTLLRRRA